MAMLDNGSPDAAGVITQHFTAQAHRPDHLDDIPLNPLSPYHRSLLVAEGTTRLIEAHALEPIRVRCTSQHPTPLSADSKNIWLGLAPGSPVVVRSVEIYGSRSGTRYAVAKSILVPQRLPEALAHRIDTDAAGIGGALNAGHVESHRELLWYGREPDGRPMRTYRVVIGGDPAMLISEWFLAPIWHSSTTTSGG